MGKMRRRQGAVARGCQEATGEAFGAHRARTGPPQGANNRIAKARRRSAALFAAGTPATEARRIGRSSPAGQAAIRTEPESTPAEPNPFPASGLEKGAAGGRNPGVAGIRRGLRNRMDPPSASSADNRKRFPGAGHSSRSTAGPGPRQARRWKVRSRNPSKATTRAGSPTSASPATSARRQAMSSYQGDTTRGVPVTETEAATGGILGQAKTRVKPESATPNLP